MESTAGSGHSICWNHPASNSRLSFNFPSATSMAMMSVACGKSRSPASSTPVCPNPWSSLCRPVSTRSTFSFLTAAAIAALRESFLDCLLYALRAHGQSDDFPAVFFLQAQRFFERVAIRLVHLEADVRFLDPVPGNRERRVLRRNLLDAHDDIHGALPSSILKPNYDTRGGDATCQTTV